MTAPDLEALRGPLHGRRQLPLHLDSSARPFYDFGTRRDRAQAYQPVLSEAADAVDLEQWCSAPSCCACGPSCTYFARCASPGRVSTRTWPGSVPGRTSRSCSPGTQAALARSSTVTAIDLRRAATRATRRRGRLEVNGTRLCGPPRWRRETARPCLTTASPSWVTMLPRRPARQVDSHSLSDRGLTLVASPATCGGADRAALGKTGWEELDVSDGREP